MDDIKFAVAIQPGDALIIKTKEGGNYRVAVDDVPEGVPVQVVPPNEEIVSIERVPTRKAVH